MVNNGCTFIASSLSDFSFGYDFESPKCIYLISRLKDYITKKYNDGVRDFYSVCEQGVDLWAAEFVTQIIKKDNSVKLHCILPYEEQAAKWHSDIRELYYKVLERADDTKFVSLHYSDDCLKRARLLTVDRSKYIFTALGSDPGNEYTEYAIKNGKSVYNFSAEDEGVRE